MRAFLKLAPNEGNMTRGVDGRTIDGFGLKDIDDIIDDLRAERFYPSPVRREFIPKPNGKLSAPEMAMQESLRGAADSEPMSA